MGSPLRGGSEALTAVALALPWISGPRDRLILWALDLSLAHRQGPARNGPCGSASPAAEPALRCQSGIPARAQERHAGELAELDHLPACGILSLPHRQRWNAAWRCNLPKRRLPVPFSLVSSCAGQPLPGSLMRAPVRKDCSVGNVQWPCCRLPSPLEAMARQAKWEGRGKLLLSATPAVDNGSHDQPSSEVPTQQTVPALSP